MLQRIFNSSINLNRTNELSPLTSSDQDSPIRIILYQDIGDKQKIILFDSGASEALTSEKERSHSVHSYVSPSKISEKTARKVCSTLVCLILARAQRSYRRHAFWKRTHAL